MFCSLVLAACAAPPAALPDGTAERFAQLEQQVATLGAMVATAMTNGAIAAASAPRDDAALTELSGRIGELVAQLATAPPATVAEASAVRDHAPAAATTGAIAALREALLAVEQLRAVCAENIANVNTPGWKRRQVELTTTRDSVSGLQLPRVQRIAATMTTGTLELSERALDVAIDGDGFFVCLAPDGERRYTRAGALQVDAEGRLVTGAGLPLQPQCNVPADTLEISITPVGGVMVRTAGNPDASTRLGTLQLARFPHAAALTAAGDNTFCAPAEAGAVTLGTPGSPGFGTLKQGFVERSNVTLVNELVNLQLAERQRSSLIRALAGFGVYVR